MFEEFHLQLIVSSTLFYRLKYWSILYISEKNSNVAYFSKISNADLELVKKTFAISLEKVGGAKG